MFNEPPTSLAPRWAVAYEPVEWEADDVDTMMSRRERQIARGPYQAAVPKFIADLPVEIDADTAAEASEAAVEIARFDAEVTQRLGAIGDHGEVSPLAAVLLRTESASSSQIEQITAGARSLAMASIGEKTGPNAALVATNTAAMQTAMALSARISAQSIIDVQTALLAKSAPKMTGAFRDRPVWIGGRGSTPHSATFVAPRHERVEDLIADLVAFAARADVAPFIQAALAHAQFETIHPFADGNGRVGRTLVHAMLRQAGVTRRMTVPVSSGLLASVEDYYTALMAYRRGDLVPIVAEFSAAAFRSVANGRALVDDLTGIHGSWLERIKARKDAVVWRALPVVIAQPAVTIAYVAAQTGVTLPAAERAVGQMVAAEVLSPVGNQKRNRVWTANEVVFALDEFAVRAGRRV